MHISTLRIENFRNLKQLDLAPHQKLNFFYGSNGAGKTSVLEALVVLARGRSFRTSQAEELSGVNGGLFRIVLEAVSVGRPIMLGLERSGSKWKARKDGEDVSVLSDLTRQLPLVLLEPNSHLLVSGAPDGRRRFLDWGMFHVEPAFLDTWRRYARALKQRNAALRQQQLSVLDSLDGITARLGQELGRFRRSYVDRLAETFLAHTNSDESELQGVVIEYQTGWKGESFLETLENTRQRDLDRGVTTQGPHRADLALVKNDRAVKTWFSRGEQKSLAAALLLAQARLFSEGGDGPLILLDDLASEFDQAHVQTVLDTATSFGGQVWVTGTQEPNTEKDCKVFHVEHGEVQEMV